MKTMKIKHYLFTLVLFTITSANAQKELDSLTYENTQDINFFRNIKNNTKIKKYVTANENVVQVGDTLILGNPTSQETNPRTVGGSYGSRGRIGAAKTRSTTTKTYEFIKMGRPAGFGSIMTAMGGEAQIMASNSFKNTKVVVNEMKAYHRGSKKKPLYVIMVLGEINGRAFGVNKYLSVMDTELALESGEVLLKNRKMTRDEAISKLKEAKELMEIDMMTKEEFEKLKIKLAPIIRKKDEN
jgi:hypothetical protein